MFRRQFLARRLFAAALALSVCLPSAQAARVDETTIANGVVSVDFTGTDAGQGNSNLRLTSMGRWRDARETDRYTIWRLRNSGTTPRSVRLDGYQTPFAVALTLRPRSDTLLRSPIIAGSATHRLYEGSTLVDTKAAGNTQWTNTTQVPPASGANRPPVFLSTPDSVVQVGEVYRYPPLVEDPDGDRVTLAALPAPAGYAYDAGSGAFRFVPLATQIGAHDVSLRADDGRGGSATQAHVLRVLADFCPLFPIAIPKTRLDPVSVGQNVNNVLGGGGANQFAWLSWSGAAGAAPLAASLVAPGDSDTYVDPDDVADRRLDLFDWTRGVSGIADSAELRSRLTALLQRELVVPEWYETRARDGGTDYHVVRFLRMRLTAFDLAGAGKLSFTYLGDRDCYELPPLANDQSLSTRRDTALDLVLAGSDPDDDALSYVIARDPEHGTLTGTAPNLRYTPAAGYEGNDRILYKAVANGVASEPAEIRITVLPPAGGNRPPVANAQDLGVAEDATLAITLTGTDPDGDALGYTVLSQPAHGSLSGTPPSLVYAPGADYHGADEFRFAVSDAQLTSASAVVRITVAAVNDPPQFTNAPSTQVAAGASYSHDANAVDVDGDTLVFALAAAPPGMTIDGTTGVIAWTPGAAQAGSHELRLTVDDGRGGTAAQSATLFVMGQNRAPRIVSIPQATTPAGATHAYDVDAQDPDAGDVLTYRLDRAPAGATQSPGSGMLEWPAPFELADGLQAPNTSCRRWPRVPGPLAAEVRWQWSGHQVLSIPLVVPLTDTDGSGRIDAGDDRVVLVSVFDGAVDTAASDLQALDARTGALLWVQSPAAPPTKASAQLAAADIDRNGTTEIFGIGGPGPHAGELVAFEHDGTLRWVTNGLPNPSYNYGGPNIADIDGDGTPEIIVRNAVVNADGSIRWSASDELFHRVTGFAADLDLDGVQEVVAGKYVYNANGTLRFALDTASNSMAAVANFDADPGPEIVTSQYGGGTGPLVNLFDSDGSRIWGPINLGDGLGGSPVVADFDGDGAPEIGVASEEAYSVLDGNGTMLWSQPIVDYSSGTTGSTVFDFDGDGIAEVLIADERALRVLNGRNGTPRLVWPNRTTTAAEFPVVADLDGDGSAEIVIVSDMAPNTGVTVLAGAQGPWLATRALWNQYDYSIGNINDDMTVPRVPARSWQSHNTFRLNAFPDRDPLGQPDLTLAGLRWNMATPDRVTVQVRNRGLAGTGQAATLEVRQGNQPGTGERVGQMVVPALAPNEAREVTVPLSSGATLAGDMHAVIDTGNAVEECIEDNNRAIASRFEVSVADAAGLTDAQQFTITVDPVNRPPTLAPATLPAGIARHVYEFRIPGADPDLGEGLSYTLLSGPSGIRVDPSIGRLYWYPSTAQQGNHTIDVRVTDLGGLSATRSYALQIGSNHAPAFVSVPPAYAEVVRGALYEFAALAVDPDGDALTYRMVDNVPPGLSVDAESGLVRWYSWQYTGPQTLTVEADDLAGGTVRQQMRVNVVPTLVNHPPVFTSTPMTVASAGLRYTYMVIAQDPDTDGVEYEVLTMPDEMSTYRYPAPDGLLLVWTPGVHDGGSNPIVVRATDGRGGEALHQFTIEVQSQGNTAPVINSTPVTDVTIGNTYGYNVDASDGDHDTLSWSLTRSPANMVIEADSGLITWEPAADQLGSHPVTVQVSDSHGGFDSQDFTVTVREVHVDRGPEITSVPVATAKVGRQYRYDVEAIDPDGDPLQFSLGITQPGSAIDARTGLLTWTPSAPGPTALAVRVVAGSAYVEQSWTVDVVPANVPLSTQITIAPDTIAPGGSIDVTVATSGAAGALTATATLAGAPVVLSPNGTTTLVAPGTPGCRTIVVNVSDGHDTASTADDFCVVDTSDTTPPLVSLASPDDNAEVTAPIDVRGTASDLNLRSWTLAVRPANSPDAPITVLAQGTQSVTDQIVGHFDPTLQLNGQYVLILQATDANGATASDSRVVRVTGDMKVGHFSITFEDASIPVAGIPVRVTRTYDSRRRDERLDFGHGWSVDYQNVRVHESARTGYAWRNYRDTADPFGNWCTRSNGDRIVTVTLPDGEVETFRARFEPECTQLAPEVYGHLVYEPIDNTHSSLEQTDFGLIRLTTVADSTMVFNLVDPGEPGVAVDPRHYRLTTADGIVYEIDQSFGLTRVTEPTGQSLTYSNGGVLHSSGIGIQFVRDALGRIQDMVLPDGQVLSYTYTTNGDLQSFTDQVDQTSTFGYELTSHPHYLNVIRDPRGLPVVRNEYDDDGRLVATIDGEGHRIEYTHDIAGRSEQVRDRRGNLVRYTYDDNGWVLAETNALGETTAHTYDANGNELTRTDPLGHSTRWTYDSRGNVLTETNALGQTTSSTYGIHDSLLTQTDALGQVVIANDYDPRSGVLLRTADALGHATRFGYDMGLGSGQTGELVVMTDALGRSTQYELDPLLRGWRVAEVDALGHRTTYTHDANGRVLTETRTRGVGAGNGGTTTQLLVTRYTYDGKGRIIRTELPDGSVTTTEYNAIDKPSRECDAHGNCTVTQYDIRGNVMQVAQPGAPEVWSTYDANGNLIETRDDGGRTTRMTYDAANRLLETILPDPAGDDGDDSNNPRTRNSYDAAGRLTSSTDERGHTTTYEYDAANRRTRVIAPPVGAASAATITAYDAAGRRTAETDPNGHTTTFSYDAAGRLTETLFADGNRARVEYDALGRKTAEIDPANRRTEYAYDALGRLTQVTLAAGTPQATVTTYGYDENGNRTEQTDAEGRVTRWTFDPAGRELTRTLPLGQSESSSYDTLGNRSRHTDFRGRTTGYAYDVANRVTGIDYPTDADTAITYTVHGQRAGATDARGETTYAYDDRDRLLRKSDPDGLTIEYTYDAAGNLVSRVSPSQSLVYTYDARNRLETVTRTIDGAPAQLTRYAYDAAGNRSEMQGADGTRTQYAYDTRHRLASLVKRTAAGALLVGMSYTVDASGMRTALTESDAAGTTRSVAYAYDALKRLTAETITHRDPTRNRSSTWTYDRVGNRLTQTVQTAQGTVGAASAATEYTYDANDRLLTESTTLDATPAVVTAYSYDANGNTLSKTSPSGPIEYVYDDANRLAEMRQASERTTYAYDADGLRIAQTRHPATGDPVTTRYLQDPSYAYSQVIEQWRKEGNGATTLEASYAFADDLIAQTRYAGTTATTRFVQMDGFGSVRWLTDAAGAITDAVEYDAFGNEIGREGTTPIEHLYRGEQFDPNLGFYYLRARWMDPASGRFTQQDALAGNSSDPASLHKYTYAEADPANGIDPSGNLTIGELMTGISTATNLSLRAVSIYTTYVEPFTIDEDSERPTLFDAVFGVMIRNAATAAFGDSETSVAPTPSIGAREDHHVIPIYLCGKVRGQPSCKIPKPAHTKFHRELDFTYHTVNVFGRALAVSLNRNARRRAAGRLNKTPLQWAARTPGGRAAIASLLTAHYANGAYQGVPYLSLGSPHTIGSALAIYGPLYVGSRSQTSWRPCKR